MAVPTTGYRHRLARALHAGSALAGCGVISACPGIAPVSLRPSECSSQARKSESASSAPFRSPSAIALLRGMKWPTKTAPKVRP